MNTAASAQASLQFLEEGVTCRSVAQADRAAVLIDGAAYYAALRSALLAAERSVFIVGWDVDSRVDLLPQRKDEIADETRLLMPLLCHLVERRPELKVHILLWDYTILQSLDREALPLLKLAWTTPPQIRVCLDSCLPVGACHHQKIVVIDDAIAFAGGLDLTIRRWDESAHSADDPRRSDPAGERYAPFHDVHMLVDGAAATSLAQLVRERWQQASGEKAPPVAPAGDPWPDEVAPTFTSSLIGVAQTRPEMDGQSELRQVEALYLRAIELAERHIYIENQYLTADRVAEALCRRMTEVERLEALIVGPKQAEGWLEAKSMGAGRNRFLRRLKDAGLGDRVRALYPAVQDGKDETPIMVHAKLMTVDDRFLRVGSANLNNRSMGLDSECDLAIEATGDEQRAAIAGVRDRLFAEHLGVQPEEVTSALEAEGSLFAVVDKLGKDTRYLAPVSVREDHDDLVSHAVRDIADVERPIDPEEFLGDMFGAQSAAPKSKRLRLLLAVAAGLVLVCVGLFLAL